MPIKIFTVFVLIRKYCVNKGETMMKRIFIIIIIIILWVFLSSGTEASSIESLKVNGGGYITCIAVSPSSPNIVYASSDLGGMYRSTDHGNNWSIIIKGLVTNADLSVTTIGIDPKNPNVVYIGTGHAWSIEEGGYEGGIFKTTNGGAEWKLLTRNVSFSACGAFDVQGRLIVVDPTNSNIVYAGSHRHGIFKSTDAGRNWKYKGLAGKYISSVVIDPTNTNTIYVSSQKAVAPTPGIYKSTDGGNNWKTLTTSYNVYDLTIDAKNPQTLYAAAFDQGIFKSTNGGSSWSSKTPSGASGYKFVSISASPTNPQIVYAKTKSANKVYITSNGGDSWGTSINLHTSGWYFSSSKFGLSSSGITVDPTNENRAYSGTWFSVWRTDNKGKDWTVKPYGLETSCAFDCTVNPNNPNELYECHADIGLFKSTNKGQTWTRISAVGVNCWTIAIDKSTNPITVYAGTGRWSGSTTSGKIYKSTDNGNSWSDTSNGLTDSRIRSIAIDPTNPSIVYSGHTNGKIYKSTNKGGSWSQKSSGLGSSEVLRIIVDSSNHNTLYAALKKSGVYKSINGGDSWSSINSGIGTTEIYDVAMSPNNNDIIFAAAKNDGIYRSTNAGANWIKVLPDYCGKSLAIDSNSVVYAGGKSHWSSFTHTGLYRSIDGIVWERIDDGLLNQGIENIEIDPTDNNRLYISTQGDGTFSVDIDPSPIPIPTPPPTPTPTPTPTSTPTPTPTHPPTPIPTPTSTPTSTPTPPPNTHTTTSRISQGSDDAEEHVHNGYIDYVSSDLELVFDRYTQTIGLRFQNIQVPDGATITNAYVEFETDETGSTSTDLTFYGEDVDNSVTFIPGYSYNVSSRIKTSASVTWLNVPAWDTVNEIHQTPDISPIIQEIVNRNNWASGNALSIIVTGSGRRTAESYNKEPDNAPFLVVEYRTDGPPAKYIPPDPVSLRNTTGNFRVNYTWQAGAGNVTDSYNISINGTWTNGTTLTYSNDTVGPHGTSTIIVYAYNTSTGGTLSSGSLTDSVTIPNNPITITNTSDAIVDEGMTVYVDYDFTDADSDTPTFGCNRTDLFTDFNTDTGSGTWSTGITDAGTYSVDFGVSDGQGSSDNYTMIITVNVTTSETCIITSRISQGSDDAEEHVHNGYIDYVSSDLELVFDRYTQTIGLRFQNIQVPDGATITNAYVEFETDETGSTSTDLTFYGEDVDNSVTFIPGYSYNVSRRTKTSASVTWLNVPAWDTVDEKHQTPDISPIIQEIVNRNNWVSGNALSIIVTGSGRRTAESYNKEPDNAPFLVVEYRTDGQLPTSECNDTIDNEVTG
jgi:photosystem II stability/assembly factor-like uncharacterized protein